MYRNHHASQVWLKNGALYELLHRTSLFILTLEHLPVFLDITLGTAKVLHPGLMPHHIVLGDTRVYPPDCLHMNDILLMPYHILCLLAQLLDISKCKLQEYDSEMQGLPLSASQAIARDSNASPDCHSLWKKLMATILLLI